MKISRAPAFLLLFSLSFFNIACGEEGANNGPPKDQNVEAVVSPALDATVIAERYKNNIVDIRAVVHRENESDEEWGGSGFFIDDQGHLATCCHVVYDDAKAIETPFGSFPVSPVVRYEYWVTLNNRKYRAELVGADKYRDVAVLKVLEIESSAYQVAKMGNSDHLRVGENVYAYGTPLGLTRSFTSGRVSALHRYIDLNYAEDYIQTDAPINPGNSGSPLINERGEVIGINGAGARGFDGLGFAIAINFADLPRLMTSGVIKLGYFGAEAMLDNFARTGIIGDPGFRDLQEMNRLTSNDNLRSLVMLADTTYPNADGTEPRAIVLEVEPKSPAALANLKRGDLIVKFNGADVKSGRDIRLQLLSIPADKEFEVKILRFEKGAATEMTFKITLLKEKKQENVK